MKPSRILVTGAQGFIGRYVVADWLAADPKVTLIGLGRSPRLEGHFTHAVHWGPSEVLAPLPSSLLEVLRTDRYGYSQLDVTDTRALARLLTSTQPDLIIHLAGALRDDPPAELVRGNIGAVVSLLAGIRESGLEAVRIIFGSSGSVYGSVLGRRAPLAEDALCAPADAYSVTKYAAEMLARTMVREYRGSALWARIFNPVGPGQDERHLCGWLGWQVAAIANEGRPPVISVGSLDTTRDFVDVRDVAVALRLLATNGEGETTYNVGSGMETSGQHVLTRLLSLAGVTGRVTIERRPPRGADLQRHYADVSRLAGLGFTHRFTLDDSLTHVLAYYHKAYGR